MAPHVKPDATSVSSIAAVCACAGALMAQGKVGFISAAIASGIVLAFLVSGRVMASIAFRRLNKAGLGFLIMTYGLRVTIVGLVLWFLMMSDIVLDSTWLLIGGGAVVVAWLLGIFAEYKTERVPIYSSAAGEGGVS